MAEPQGQQAGTSGRTSLVALFSIFAVALRWGLACCQAGLEHLGSREATKGDLLQDSPRRSCRPALPLSRGAVGQLGSAPAVPGQDVPEVLGAGHPDGLLCRVWAHADQMAGRDGIEGVSEQVTAWGKWGSTPRSPSGLLC